MPTGRDVYALLLPLLPFGKNVLKWKELGNKQKSQTLIMNTSATATSSIATTIERLKTRKL